MKKILSLALVGVMMFSALPMAYASDTVDYTNGTQVTLVGTLEEAAGGSGAQWTVTVPAKLAPGGSSKVTASGTWAADQFITVYAPKTIKLTYGAESMDVAVSLGTNQGFSRIGDNTTAVSGAATVRIDEATRLFGTWDGILEYEVKLIENGDVNRDGIINTADSKAIRNSLLKLDDENYAALTEEQKVYADMDGNGNIDSSDALMIEQLTNYFYVNAVNAVQPVE